jgi:hypothetical protein
MFFHEYEWVNVDITMKVNVRSISIHGERKVASENNKKHTRFANTTGIFASKDVYRKTSNRAWLTHPTVKSVVTNPRIKTTHITISRGQSGESYELAVDLGQCTYDTLPIIYNQETEYNEGRRAAHLHIWYYSPPFCSWMPLHVPHLSSPAGTNDRAESIRILLLHSSTRWCD